MPKIFPIWVKRRVVRLATGAGRSVARVSHGVRIAARFVVRAVRLKAGVRIRVLFSVLSSPIRMGVRLGARVVGAGRARIRAGAEVAARVAFRVSRVALSVRAAAKFVGSVRETLRQGVSAVSRGVGQVLEGVSVGAAVVTRGRFGGSRVSAGSAAGVRADGQPFSVQKMGNGIEVTFNLTRVAWADDTTSGAPSWQNIVNAQGEPNGLLSTRNGQLLSSTESTLNLFYPEAVGKELVGNITGVFIRFHTAQAGTMLNNGGMSHRWTFPGGPFQVLQSFTGNVNFLSNGIEYDITSAPGAPSTWSWEDFGGGFGGVRAHVHLSLNVGTQAVQGQCDAVSVRVTATS